MIRRITAPGVPEPPPGLFSNALLVDGTLHLSGQHAGVPGGGVVGGDRVEAQAREALRRVRALVEAAGGTMADVVKLTVYVTDMARRGEVAAARRAVFDGVPPCSTLVEVTGLAAPGLLVEIDAVAVIGAAQEG
ncbi:RidA family protein [Azospirillum sp. ST 5-10]|uniref:RidA family protein n=1 Tax=unclassified Azospirillum TaxID=2630922 RepID=UPI003F4A0A1E